MGHQVEGWGCHLTVKNSDPELFLSQRIAGTNKEETEGSTEESSEDAALYGAAAPKISYQTHVQTYGWQAESSNGQANGTTGKAKRLEGIRICLTGEAEQLYDIYYQVHAQSYGWLGWAKNGEPAGTAGYGKRLEGIRICLVPRGGSAPGSTANAYVSKNGV